jgi:hypothetical protein
MVCFPLPISFTWPRGQFSESAGCALVAPPFYFCVSSSALIFHLIHRIFIFFLRSCIFSSNTFFSPQPNFSIPQIRKVMDSQTNIRNMCVIAQYPSTSKIFFFKSILRYLFLHLFLKNNSCKPFRLPRRLGHDLAPRIRFLRLSPSLSAPFPLTVWITVSPL